MTAAEEGVLLLCSRLGDENCKPLTEPQFRKLGLLVLSADRGGDAARTLHRGDLLALGCDSAQAEQLLSLLDRENLLRAYLAQGERQGIFPLTRLSPGYPQRLRTRLRQSCPPVLFYRGDRSLLDRPAIAAVGSRHLHPENEAFARRVGQLAAENGLILVSGGAIGADQVAQEACLAAGGSCIIAVPDRLDRFPAHDRALAISIEGYDLPFSTPRALLRNHLIHILGRQTLVAQCSSGSGGTWQGCMANFKHSWSDLFVFDDRSAGAAALLDRGATPLPADFTLAALKSSQLSLF